MTDVIEYLSTGRVNLMKTTCDYNEHVKERYLGRLIALRDLAIQLGMNGLRQQACAVICQRPGGSASLFVHSATQCREANSKVDVSKGSEVGTSIRKHLIKHLKELESGGYVDEITQQGGKLVGILVKVLVQAQQSGSVSGV